MYSLRIVFVVVLLALFSCISQAQVCPPTDGFESGYNGWVVQDFTFPLSPAVIDVAGKSQGFGFFASQPTEGLYSFQNGFDAGSASNLTLSKTMLWTARTMTFTYKYAWDLQSFCGSTCLPRIFSVNFYDSISGMLVYSQQILNSSGLPQIYNSTSPWIGSVDASSVVGMTVRAEFLWIVPEASTGPAFFELDNIQYLNCAPTFTCSPSCKNGGTCVANNTCSCPANFTGSICEHRIATPSLAFAPTGECPGMEASNSTSAITFADPVPYGYYVIGARLQLNVTTFCEATNITATLNGIQIGTQSLAPLCNCSSDAVLLELFLDQWNSTYFYDTNTLIIEGDSLAWTAPVLDLYISNSNCPDSTPPTITMCPAPVVLTADPTTCRSYTPDFVSLAEGVDGCGRVFINQSIANGTSLAPGIYPVDITFSDFYGDNTTCNSQVTVVDITPPTVSCPAPITLNADSTCRAPVPWLLSNISAWDACGTSYGQSPFGSAFFPSGLNYVNVTARDVSGNTASCQVPVTVVDSTNPTVTCPSDITVNACEYTADNYTSRLLWSDNCGIVNISQSVPVGQSLPQGSYPVTITVVDVAGNQGFCTFNVHVIDTVNPNITCDAPLVIAVDEYCQIPMPNVTNFVTADDGCFLFLSQNPAPNSSLVSIGNFSVDVTASDYRGNTATCSKSVQVIDATFPDLQCTSDITVQVDSMCQASIPSILPYSNYTDNCGIVQIMQLPASGGVHTRGNYTVSLSACDHFHNVATCESTVHFVDTIFPVITCPARIEVNASATCQATFPDLMALSTASDNCGFTLSQFPAVGTPLGLGEFSVTVRVTDFDGNFQECNSTVVVFDNSEPELPDCVPSRTHKKTSCDGDSSLSEVPSFIVDGFELATDNCNLTQVIQNPLPGTKVPIGVYNITLTFVDASGNEMICMTEYKYEEADPEQSQGIDKGMVAGVAVGVPGGMGISGALAFFAWSKLKKFIKIEIKTPEIPQPSLNLNPQLVLAKQESEDKDIEKGADQTPPDEPPAAEPETKAVVVADSEYHSDTSREEKPIPDAVDNPSGSLLGSSRSSSWSSESSGTQASYDTPDTSESESE